MTQQTVTATEHLGQDFSAGTSDLKAHSLHDIIQPHEMEHR